MKTLAAAVSLVALGLLSLGLSGAAAADPTPAASPPPSHSACFWRQDVSGFAAHDDTAIYLRVGVRDVYELKMFGNCFDLSWLHHIGLQSHGMSNICEGSNPDVDVIVRDIGIGHQRCPVTSVRKLTPAEIAALPRDARP